MSKNKKTVDVLAQERRIKSAPDLYFKDYCESDFITHDPAEAVHRLLTMLDEECFEFLRKNLSRDQLVPLLSYGIGTRFSSFIETIWSKADQEMKGKFTVCFFHIHRTAREKHRIRLRSENIIPESQSPASSIRGSCQYEPPFDENTKTCVEVPYETAEKVLGWSLNNDMARNMGARDEVQHTDKKRNRKRKRGNPTTRAGVGESLYVKKKRGAINSDNANDISGQPRGSVANEYELEAEADNPKKRKSRAEEEDSAGTTDLEKVLSISYRRYNLRGRRREK